MQLPISLDDFLKKRESFNQVQKKLNSTLEEFNNFLKQESTLSTPLNDLVFEIVHENNTIQEQFTKQLENLSYSVVNDKLTTKVYFVKQEEEQTKLPQITNQSVDQPVEIEAVASITKQKTENKPSPSPKTYGSYSELMQVNDVPF